jgi:hypothetical protein
MNIANGKVVVQTLENSMEIIIKFKVELPDDPEIPLMRNNGEKS